jgi:hypothetical protein
LVSGATSRTRLFFERLHEDAAAIATNLRKTHVELSLARPSPAGEIAAALATTLLLRLADDAPHIHLVAPDVRVVRLPRLSNEPLFEALAREHDGFASVERFSSSAADAATIKLAFDGGEGVSVTSNGWTSAVGESNGTSGNPLAAAFAGVLAANEAFKAALVAAGVEERRARQWRGRVSLWDYSLGDSAGVRLTETIELSPFAFVGCGGIGSAAAWALSLLPLTGSPAAIDHDAINETNLNRHLTASYRDIGVEKAELTRALLDAAGTTALAYGARWQELAPEERRVIDVPLVSVDDDRTRRDLQLTLPRLVLNAGTSDEGLYQVTRHDFINGACLCCIARADQVVSSLEENVARYLGIPLDEFLAFTTSADPLPDDVLKRVRENERENLRGIPGREITRVVCGRLRLPAGGPAVSAPTLSATPGVLLATEAVKVALRAQTPLDSDQNALVASVLRGPHERWLMRREKRVDCVCGDELYLAYYHRKWNGEP